MWSAGFVGPEWALLGSQSKTGDHYWGKLGLVVGKSGLRVQPLRLGGHEEEASTPAGGVGRPPGGGSSLKFPVRDPAADLYKVDNL